MRYQEIADRLRAELVEALEDAPTMTVGGFEDTARYATADAVPVLTTNLFSLFVENNELAFVDIEREHGDAFSAAQEAVERKLWAEVVIPLLVERF